MPTPLCVVLKTLLCIVVHSRFSGLLVRLHHVPGCCEESDGKLSRGKRAAK